MRHYTYTEDQLRDAVAGSMTRQEVFRKLGLSPTGKGYKGTMRRITDLGLDTSHFLGQRWRTGQAPINKRTLDEMLTHGSGVGSHALRLRLIAEGVFEARCSNCRLDTWLGDPIPLELHHIDGDHQNNEIGNLEIRCPNCHSMTATHAGKCNRGIQKKLATVVPKFCNCGNAISRRSSACRSCAGKASVHKIDWPDNLVLQAMLDKGSYRSVGRALNVSDVAVKKRAMKLGLTRPPTRG